MTNKHGPLIEIAEYLPEIMRRLFGGRLIASGAWELTIPQLRALSLVADRPSCTMGELSESLGIGLSAATGLADRLVQHGLLEREADPEDRRLVRLRLTEAGRRAREACRSEKRRQVEEALQRLSADEQSQIAAALVLLHGALDAAKPSIRPGEEEKQGE
jgi:DNA-binding MarR family transcriptional regulator